MTPVQEPAPLPAEATVVSLSEAAALRRAGATLVDARPLHKRLGRGVPGALQIGWRSTSRGWARDSALPDDRAALRAWMVAHGVAWDRPVLTLDNGDGGWGEGARVAWTLAQLGHPAAHWLAARVSLLPKATEGALPSPAQPIENIGPQTIVDVRSAAEFAGSTPYGEARGGHLPGALSLPFDQLWTPQGTAISAPALRALTAQIGIPHDRPLQCLCTGGVRSAAATLLLRHAGLNAVNDAGGMWARAADPGCALETS